MISIALAVALLVVNDAPLLIVKLPLPEPSLSTSTSIRPLPALTVPLRDTPPSELITTLPPPSADSVPLA